IHNRGDHAHVVGCRLIHAPVNADLATPQVARANHHSNLYTQVLDGLNSFGDKICLVRVDSTAVAGERLAAEFEHNPPVARLAGVIRLMTIHVKSPLPIEWLPM